MLFAKDYKFVDRLLHYVAFSSPVVQKSLCELENDLYGDDLLGVESDREVFVTALPRAGTTLILELLYHTGEFQTFTYRDMPFILAPLLWDKVSKPFQRKAIIRERAHGDGMVVSFDSPEAFEEVVWLTYLKDRIVTENWLLTLSAGEYTEEFADALKASVRKIILKGQRCERVLVPQRYLSKNNANLSRVEVIADLFPNSIVLVPFRQPLYQAASLKKQHERFLAQHEVDNFGKRYMQWLGHFEFGQNFKPINFGGWLTPEMDLCYLDDDFWLQYWVAAYAYALDKKMDNLYFVNFDKLLKEKKTYLDRISVCVGLACKETLMDTADMLRSPTTAFVDRVDYSAETRHAAQEVYEELCERAI